MDSEVHSGNSSQESITEMDTSIEDENEGTNGGARLRFLFRKTNKIHREKNADPLSDSY